MFVKVSADVLEINPFTAMGSDGFLIAAGTARTFNAMTASWGAMGVLWGRRSITVYVRKSRHTHRFLESSTGFTCSFFGSEMHESLLWCGSHSGLDGDKIANSGLVAVPLPAVEGIERVTFEQAKLVFSCTKAAVIPLDSSQFVLPEIGNTYRQGDFHTAFVGFIDTILVNQ